MVLLFKKKRKRKILPFNQAVLKIIVIKESGCVGRGRFNNQIPKECTQLIFHLVLWWWFHLSFVFHVAFGQSCSVNEIYLIYFTPHLFISCQSSSICRAAIHYGILDNKGGLVDITRKGRTPGFVKSTRNGVESFRYFLHQKLLYLL